MSIPYVSRHVDQVTDDASSRRDPGDGPVTGERDAGDAPREGDVRSSVINGQYHSFHVLRIDTLGNRQHVYHVKCFAPVDVEPVDATIDTLDVFTWHVPLASIDGSTLVGHRPVTGDDLQGFHAFLRDTDFTRYLHETGRTVDDAIHEATAYYRQGNDLSDARRYEDAIEAYGKAIQAFPMLHEAIDNLAFALMDLGRWEEASHQFQRSLRVNPGNIVAIFSTGECCFKLGQFDQAITHFQAALAIDPGHEPSRQWLQAALSRRDHA